MMGNIANSVEVITTEILEKICGDAYNNFIKSLNTQDLDIDDLMVISAIEFGDWGDLDCDDVSAIKSSYNSLVSEFNALTNLTLSIGGYNSVEGSPYDELEDGHFWEVGNVYQITPQALLFKEIHGDDSIKTQNYSVYG